jgi:hypothetical protein
MRFLARLFSKKTTRSKAVLVVQFLKNKIFSLTRMVNAPDNFSEIKLNLDESLKQIKRLQPKIFSNHPNREKSKSECDIKIKQLYSQYPNEPKVLTVLGAVLCNNGEYQNALEQLIKARELGFKDRNLYRSIAATKFYIQVINNDIDSNGVKSLFEEANQFEPHELTFEAYLDAN